MLFWDAWRAGRGNTEPLLNRALRHPSKETREAAARELARVAPHQGAALLAGALQDEETSVRCAAAEAICGFDSPAAIDALLAALGSTDADVRRHAALGLARSGSAASGVPAARLCEVLLTEETVGVRDACVEALKQVGDPDAVVRLCDGLKDACPRVRPAIARSTATLLSVEGMHDTRALEPLLAAVGDTNADVRHCAAAAVAEFGSAAAAWPGTVEALCTALQDSDQRVRGAAAESLGKLGDPRAFDGLCRALRDPDGRVCLSAVAAVASVGGCVPFGLSWRRCWANAAGMGWLRWSRPRLPSRLAKPATRRRLRSYPRRFSVPRCSQPQGRERSTG